MPGSKEYINALEEGARFEFLTAPVALEGNAAGEVARVRCIRMELGEPDASGRRKPRPVKGSEFTISKRISSSLLTDSIRCRSRPGATLPG